MSDDDAIRLPELEQHLTGFYYAESAVQAFLRHNQLHAVIRGHAYDGIGFRVLMNGKVTTLSRSLSSSNHVAPDTKGNDDGAACALVDRRTIQLMRINTRAGEHIALVQRQ